MLVDYIKFEKRFREGYMLSAPQVYYSGLAFAPKNSVVPKLYNSLLRNFITVSGDIEIMWPPSETLVMHGLSFPAAVAFSSDGTRIVSGSRDKTIRLWDAATEHVNVGLTTPWRQHEWISIGEEETQSRILWIPHPMRRHVFISHPCKMVIAARPKVTIQFHNAAWGPNWTQIKG